MSEVLMDTIDIQESVEIPEVEAGGEQAVPGTGGVNISTTKVEIPETTTAIITQPQTQIQPVPPTQIQEFQDPNQPLSPNGKPKPLPQIPILVQVSWALAWGITITTVAFVGIIAIRSGSKGLELILRTGTVTIIVGMLCWGLAWMVTNGSLEITQKYLRGQLNGKEENIIDEADDLEIEDEIPFEDNEDIVPELNSSLNSREAPL